MFEALLVKVNIGQADLQFELARCTDPYRLNLLLKAQLRKLQFLQAEAEEMVNELEGR